MGMVAIHRDTEIRSVTMLGMEEIPYSGKNLEKKRKELGLSRKDVSTGTGLSESSVYAYENETKDPTIPKINLIGAYFSKVAKRKIRFACEWDTQIVEEYGNFDPAKADQALQQ